MHRILLVTVGAFLVATGTHLAAQKPSDARTVRPNPGAVVVTATAPAAVVRTLPRMLPGTRPSVFTTIQGNALTSTNGALPDSVVRLRDARSGRIVDTQLTDSSGLFAFRSIDPGSYIVEIMGNDQAVLGASQLLNVNAGEAISAVVKLPFRIPPFAGLFGHTLSQAAAVTSSAAASGVLSTVIAKGNQPASF
jgi:hypothetical protein